jgi:peptide/nickel transport system ATP-binding protein
VKKSFIWFKLVDMNLLEIKNLKTYYETRKGKVKAVDEVSFELKSGEIFGLAGESGCGKSTLGLSILQLLPPQATIFDGSIMYKDINLLKCNEDELRKIRWNDISIIFQSSMSCLNPVLNVGFQIAEALKLHEKLDDDEAYDRVDKLFMDVGIDPSRKKEYPHEFSGGMRQRVMIAMALSCNPSILIADEPVTALDVMVQAQILKLLKEIQRESNIGVLFITHDLAVFAEISDRLGIMYAGNIVEYSDVNTMFESSAHPYTQMLIAAFPSIKGEKKRLEPIYGAPPGLINPPTGCKFHPRCQYTIERCKVERPLLLQIEENHFSACHLSKKFL